MVAHDPLHRSGRALLTHPAPALGDDGEADESTTLESPEWQNTTVLEGDVGEAVSRLKQEDGGTITINGSATLPRSLLSARLVDELRLLLHPVVLSSGHRLFDNAEDRVDLELTDCHAYDNGVVSLTYQPTER